MRSLPTFLKGKKLYSYFKYGECSLVCLTKRLIYLIDFLVVCDLYHFNSSFAKEGGGRKEYIQLQTSICKLEVSTAKAHGERLHPFRF